MFPYIHTRLVKAAILLALFCAIPVGCGGGGVVTPAGIPDPDPEPDPNPVPLAWNSVPSLTLTVGVPVDTDLRDSLDGWTASTAITLDRELPDGLRLEGGVIRGTPQTEIASSDYVATADGDGTGVEVVVSSPFSISVVAGTGGLVFEQPTPEQIGIYIPFGSAPFPTAPPADATATVRYRKAADSTWKSAHPLLRIVPEWNSSGAPEPPSDAFAGSIFDLEPGTTYDIEVTVSSPSMSDVVLQSVHATRGLPSTSGPANKSATPSDDLGAIVDDLEPGDVLELKSGAYGGFRVAVSGTAQQPIVIRGEDRESVVVSETTGNIIQLTTASHVILENMTLQGGDVDTGTGADSTGISFWDGAFQEFVTMRDLDLLGVDIGIVASGATASILVYNCRLVGNNEWNADFLHTNLTWNDDGVRLPGQGNCVFENTVHGFGDTFAVKNRVHNAAVYFYRNRVTMTGDDAWEADYGTRNLAFYDNHIANCSTLMSCDPVWGGPVYCFRNIVVNAVRGPYKLNSMQSGFLIYNNTVVRTEGTTNWGWVQFSNGDLRGWSYRNNIIHYQGTTGNLMALESRGMDPIDFTNNGWYPDGDCWWSKTGASEDSLAAVRDALPATTPLFGTSTKRHEFDIIMAAQPFTTTIPLGSDHLTEITSLWIPALGSTSSARGGGVAIPGITDGYSGNAPDMGAVITGRTNPTWGADR